MKPGDRVAIEAASGGRLSLRAAESKIGWDEACGILTGRTGKVASIKEMNESIGRRWAGLK